MKNTKETRTGVEDEFCTAVKNYEDGNVGLLDTVITLRKQRKLLESIVNEIKDFEYKYYNELEIASKDVNNQYMGAKFSFRAGKKTFDFSEIEEVKIARENLKEIEGKYKSAWYMQQKGMMPVDEQTGEVLKVPLMKQSKSSLTIDLKNVQ